jgi:hypothetical protein
LPGGSALAGPRPAEYSAHQFLESEDGILEQKLFAAPGKQRIEMEDSVIIVRLDKGVQWVLMPGEMMYMEQRLDPASAGSEGWEQETTLVGPDSLDGLPTTKFKTIARRKGSQDKFGGFTWETAEGIVVKMDLLSVEEGKKERFRLELKNLEVGPQKAELFEVPPGYEKMSLTGFGAKALGGSGDPQEDAPVPAAEKGAPSAGDGVGGAIKELGKGLKGLLKW